MKKGLLQNDKVHQDIVYCFQTETYILYENLILQQPQDRTTAERNMPLSRPAAGAESCSAGFFIQEKALLPYSLERRLFWYSPE